MILFDPLDITVVGATPFHFLAISLLTSTCLNSIIFGLLEIALAVILIASASAFDFIINWSASAWICCFLISAVSASCLAITLFWIDLFVIIVSHGLNRACKTEMFC